MQLTFWGTRGSIPVPGKEYTRYGGNTPCLEIYTKSGETIIVDAGSGLRPLGRSLLAQNKRKEFSILISHTHWDHIHGIPFFRPLYVDGYKFDFYLPGGENVTPGELIDIQMQPKYFPVTRESFHSEVNFHGYDEKFSFPFKNIKVEAARVHHSKNTFAFKFTEENKSIVYMTDNEIEYNAEKNNPDPDNIYVKNDDLISFCKGADYLIHDSMYFFNEFESKIGWGHSNNKSLAIFASLAEVKNLVLFHYDPDDDDNRVDKLVKETKEFLGAFDKKINCIASEEQLKIII